MLYVKDEKFDDYYSELLIYFMVKITNYLYIYFKQKVNYKPILLV